MYKDHQRAKAWESTVRKAQQQQQQLEQCQTGRRRGCNIFAPMAAVAPDDDTPDTPTSTASSAEQEEAYHAERRLPNGDFYTGQWAGGLPHGTGKYLWTDGCMYEGEWRGGKTMGRGKFSWPSGATYEGEFKSGFMDGYGTYTGSSGDTYRGLWSMNLKHGPGKKCYANGDYYDGEWRSGLQDGHGRYLWRNGSEYIGHWRDGLLHGRGCLAWANGNRYDGGWEDGVPRGSGSFRWADGSLYVGLWTREPGGVQQKGVFYPSPAATSPTARDPQEAFTVDLLDCKISPGETFSILPSQKTLHWSSGAESDPLYKQALWRSSKGCSDPTGFRPRRRAGLDAPAPGAQPPRRPNSQNGGARERSLERISICESDGDTSGADIADRSAVAGREGAHESISELRIDEVEPRSGQSQQQTRWPPRARKKQGVTICKGHRNYELMLNLQLGIRHAVGKQQGLTSTSLDLKASAFDPKEKVWSRFPPEGTKYTPPHQTSEFRWKDYCPLVFRTLRRLFKVDAADYMISICGNDALRELSSPGKSGSFFYLTYDDRYMIKTVKKAEVKVLLRMLPAYYNHVCAFENTLVTKFFGLHCVKLTGAAQKKVRFVIMGNLFCSEYPIHRRFDLKGSSHGRTTDKPDAEIDETTTLKDLDLNFIFRLERYWFQDFHRQVDRDCEFLEQERIMDYSLLVGLHFRDTGDIPSIEGNGDIVNTNDATPRLSRAGTDQFLADLARRSPVRLGSNMPATVEQTTRRSDCDSGSNGEPTGELYDVVLFFGIIDILQDYDISKKLEHAYKSFQYDPTSISAVDPKLYSKRFREFIYKVFMEDS